MTHPFSLENRSAVITGGGTGIGLGIARAFVEAGARVVICGRRSQVLDQAASELGSAATAVRADVTSEQDLETVAGAARTGGRDLDIWVNNAGILERGVLPDADAGHLERMLAVNVTGAYLGCRVALRPMLAAGRGVIINIASYLAEHSGATATLSGYSASKAALVAMTRSLAVRHGPQGIRVNAICPALVPTGLNAEIYDGHPDREARDRELGERYPLRRIGRPEDVGAAAVYLSGDGASWVTGQALAVDGGISAV